MNIRKYFKYVASRPEFAALTIFIVIAITFYIINENFLNFVSFIKKNSSKIINFDKAIENIDNNIFSKLSRVTIEKSLKLIRLF